MKVHRTLGGGFLESVYKRALQYELIKNGLQAELEKPIKVLYEGVTVGEYACDVWVNDELLIEIKAVREVAKAHEAQLVNYLNATGMSMASS